MTRSRLDGREKDWEDGVRREAEGAGRGQEALRPETERTFWVRWEKAGGERTRSCSPTACEGASTWAPCHRPTACVRYSTSSSQ